jgi:hypothetical protein
MDKLLTIMGPDGERENTALAIANATTLGKSTFLPFISADQAVEVVERKKGAESTQRVSAPDLPILAPIMVDYSQGLDELGEQWPVMQKSKSSIRYVLTRQVGFDWQ